MAIGPVEYIVVGFPENNFHGAIAPALADLIDSKIIRVLDLVALEFDQLSDGEIEAFHALDADIGGVLSAEDIEHAASFLEPSSSAALVVWEDLWAAPFADAVREAGGVLLEGARVPYELVSAVEALAE